MRVLLLFLDGVGIGKPDGSINPFFKAKLPNLRLLLGGELPHSQLKRISTARAELIPANATLGVAGLPQSGTGQTAIFTGVNAPKFVGKHFGPHPTTTLRPVIEKKNIFRLLKSARKSVCFANAFPKQFFEYTNSGTRRLTVTTLSCQFSGVPLLTSDSLRQNEAISADITRTHWPKLGYLEIPPVSSEEAGRHLWSIAAKHDFTLFEYWLTDHAGHSRDMDFSVDILERFDGLLGGLLEEFDFANSLLVLISDHGNIEDLSTKSHTRNTVPCMVVGKKRKEFSSHIKNLTHITPALLKFLEV